MRKFLVLFLFICFAGSALAQSKYSVLDGKVTFNGSGLPGVTIILTGPKLMGQRSVSTDSDGGFRFTMLPPGSNFEFKATLSGFQPYLRKNVTLALGKTTTIDFEMKESALTEEIVVTAESPLIDTKSSSTSTNFDSEFIEKLTNDRQFQMVMAMMPGAVEGNNPSMLGGAATDNLYLVDGADRTDPRTNTWGAAMNFDILDEIQVVTGGISAEHGRTQGAVVNLVTKSGGNEFHGNVRFVKSDIDWNKGADGLKFDEATKYTTEDRWAATLGGPIIKDKLWFFISYEKRDKTKQTFHWADWDNFMSLDRTQQKAENPSYAGHYLSVKLTYQLNDNHSFSVLYSEDPIEFPLWSYLNDETEEWPFKILRKQGGDNLLFEWNWVVSDDSFVTFKYNHFDGPLSNLPNPAHYGPSWDTPAMVYIDDYGNSFYPYIGAAESYYDSSREYDEYSVSFKKFLDTSYGSHDLSIGVSYRDATYGDLERAYNGGPSVEFWDYDAYDMIIVRDVTDNRERSNVFEKYQAIYLNDEWSVTDSLTLNLGLRAEELTMDNWVGDNVIDQGFSDSIAPRLGITYDMDGSKLFFNMSRYYDVINNEIVRNNQVGQFYHIDFYYSMFSMDELLASGLRPWESFDDYAQINPNTHPELYGFWFGRDYGGSNNQIIGDIESPYMDEFSLGYERQLSPLLSAGVTYTNRKWKNSYEDQDWDQDGGSDWSSFKDTYRKYNALIFTLKKKMADDGFTFQFSYVYSETKGYKTGDSSSGYYDTPYNIRHYYGLINDVPQQIKFNGSYTFDFGLLVGLNFQYFSGVSYAGTVSVANELDTGTIGVFAEERGSRRLPSNYRFDLHVEYSIKVWENVSVAVYADIFNLLNTRSVLSVETNMGSGYYDTDLSAYTPAGDLNPEWVSFIQNNDPVISDVNDTFGDPIWYQFPRSFNLGFNVKF